MADQLDELKKANEELSNKLANLEKQMLDSNKEANQIATKLKDMRDQNKIRC